MRSVLLRRGEIVRIGSLSGGAVLYVSVEGGFDIAPVLGSCSTYLRGGFGGWQGRALTEGDCLPLRRNIARDIDDLRLEGIDLTAPPSFRVILGPQTEYFAEDEIQKFLSEDYSISPGSDRMGMRLEGLELKHKDSYNIVSDAIAPGSIQVPGTGLPIILLADRQTCGGYPKIATVISADLPALGRLPIGATVSFKAITVEEAQIARRALLSKLDAIYDMLVPVRSATAGPAPRLSDFNLISGVCDAFSWVA
jgi:biotin-dependent carboxylase-like uncharacterized protein